MTQLRRVLFGSAVVLCSCADGAAPSMVARVPAEPSAAAAAITLGATPVAVDGRGVARLLRGDAMPAIAAADATSSARGHAERLAPAWGVRAGAMPALDARGEVPVQGGTIVRLGQTLDGLPVAASAGGELRMMVRKDGSLVAASGTLIASDLPRAAVAYVDDEAGAVARAIRALYRGSSFSPAALAVAPAVAGGAPVLGGESGSTRVAMARARKAWWPEEDQLTPVWVVEAYSSQGTSTSGEAYRTVIAADGRVLEQTNLTDDAAFTYRVFAEPDGELTPFDGPIVDSTPSPTGVPDLRPFPVTAYPAYAKPNLVTVEGLNHPAGSTTPDPWLADGRTETLGNNVDAYTDLSAPDGLSFGDFRATVTGERTFDRSYSVVRAPLFSQAQQMAGITSLFYIVNWVHDFWYDAGFTEAAGNAQNLNFGRGGEDRDALLAEAQDNARGGSRNNANMATPSDGLSPRMQVFVWDNKDRVRSLAIANRSPRTGVARFAPGSFTAAGEVVLASDGTEPGSDACQDLPAAVAGKIVLVDRGGCTVKRKALAVQAAGGAGMILADDAPGEVPPALGDDATIATAITIGVLSVTQAEGAAIRTDLAAGALPATLRREADVDLDGTLDASVVSHELGHYLHRRLSACNTRLCSAMSEGWADFAALLLMARAGDDLDGAYPVGVYSTRSFGADPAYFGIRRAPYSVSPSQNALAFRHMSNGVPLPTQHPINAFGRNSEVHNAGEVWASMLWEGYVALQKAGRARGESFEAVRDKMRKYVVAGLLLAPPDNTPTEMRDAILTAVHAASPADHDVLAAAYARRGFGSCAVSPARSSQTFEGIVDSNVVAGRIEPGALEIRPLGSCDHDEVLDAGEGAQIELPLANTGPAALEDVTVTLATDTPGVQVSQPVVQLGQLAAYGHTTATFGVVVDSALAQPAAGVFHVTITARNGCSTSLELQLQVPVNTDDRLASSATDTFDAIGSVWTPEGDPALWSHQRRAPLDGLWHGANATTISDASLVSPPLTAGTGELRVTFSHRFAFEFAPATITAPAQAFDGGVIEYATSEDGTWKDVSELAAPGYNQEIVAGENPLGGRRGFGGTNPSFPAADTVTLDLGTQLRGKTFRLRFRVGTDSMVGAPGWEIDDVAFTGLAGTPFPALVADAGRCEGARPADGDGGCCQSGQRPGGGAVGAALAALAVLLRRRRPGAR